MEKNALAGVVIEKYGGTNLVKAVEVFGFYFILLIHCLRIKKILKTIKKQLKTVRIRVSFVTCKEAYISCNDTVETAEL